MVNEGVFYNGDYGNLSATIARKTTVKEEYSLSMQVNSFSKGFGWGGE